VRTGPATPDFAAEKVVSTLTNEACAFLRARAGDRQRFFLYLALTSPHTPVAPAPEWKGKCPVGPYGDFVMETDHAAGAVLETLRGSGLDPGTLVIFTSDNGATPDNAKTLTVRGAGHRANHPWRGAKSDIWEGGHRVPFIARWPGTTPAGTECSDPICLNTLMATAAALTKTAMPAGAAPDSFSIAPLLRGEKPDKSTHPFMIHHSVDGLFAIRRGQWKFIDGPGSGGWSKDPPASTPGQLYNLTDDPGETNNFFDKVPGTTAELRNLLRQCREDGM
jgi:arylsulfatase A-like enzyme